MDIKAATAADLAPISKLHDAAFGTPHEGRLVADLTHSDLAVLSLVARENGTIVGHILFSPLVIDVDDDTVMGLALAPLAVLPPHQNRGIGTALTRAGLVAAVQHDWQAVIVLGHPSYYSRFGFSATLAQGFESPFAGPYLMALELIPGALSGRKGKIIYPPPFTALAAGEPQNAL
ncbi:GNAT family N-acetyltransferase [Dongia rigui]|uniref:N-acetyltransferase n=1 Tax=Dongia rigui TaxID=940149 RepID=A0ABU5DZZ0_9PROT|nr:N-acetyltransferase [Dongia rigui]MDY0872208.1 N-acetyltransferase [Dongia rigui]